MNTHYTKDDVVELASVIFTNDINSDAVAESGMPTDQIAEASFYAAEVFFNTASAYHRGELQTMLNNCHRHSQCEAGKPVEQRLGERRKGDRRGFQETGCFETETAQTTPEEDEAFDRLEQALKDQFLAATLHNIFKRV